MSHPTELVHVSDILGWYFIGSAEVTHLELGEMGAAPSFGNQVIYNLCSVQLGLPFIIIM